MKTILVIDDNADVLDLTAQLLELAGYRVATADGGVQGIEVMGLTQPDLVLLDIRMPDLGGFDVIRYLRREYSGVPILFLSAFADVAELATKARAAGYVRKPFSSSELLEAVGRALGE